MDFYEFNQCKAGLYQAFNHAAPTGAIQRAFVSFTQEMELAGESHKAVLCHMASALIDGLQYGNWIGAAAPTQEAGR